MTRIVSLVRPALRALLAGLAAGVILVMLGVGIGLLQGYRPVVITTGSMRPTAAPGSLVIAQPVSDVAIGDVVIMRRDGRATITHRIVDLERNEAGAPFAITRGDANSEVDSAPYALGSEELVSRWVFPGVGKLLVAMGSPLVGITVVGLVVLLVIGGALRRIWGLSADVDDAPPVVLAAIDEVPGPARIRRRLAVGAVISVLFTGSGVAWSLYLSTDSVAGNLFSTADCFDARLGGVQSGQMLHTAVGSQTAAIAAVDPAASFLLFSVRSASGEPDESQVLGRLVDSTTVEFVRQSDAGSPPAIDIEWSVVEYACGVSVQRGVLAGDGTSQIDVPITGVDPSSSFVVGSSAPSAGSTDHDADDLYIFDQVADDTLQIRTAGSPIPVGHQLAWQVVSFVGGGDLAAQTVTTTLTPGLGSDTLALGAPVDPTSTFLLASTATTSTGPEIGERMVRVRLLDSTTVEVSRQVVSESIEVSVQVIELGDGSTVRHGIVDLSPAETSAAVTIAPVDLSRSVAISTVMVPGSSSGGSTDQTADDVLGEGSVAVDLVDAATVNLTRTPSGSNASFAWQVITWGGPSWGDPSSPFRQRLDITAGGVDAPDGYTTPLTFDHASLVESGLSLANGDDLRVWRYDGAVWTELDRVRDENSVWDAADSTFWFRTQESIVAADTISYWLYFGDPSPPAPLADPANVWLLIEGFEGGTLGSFEDRTAGGAWYRALPWSRRIVLTIDSAAVASDLFDVPVLVRFTEADLAAQAQADGSDLRFTAADGTTGLSHEIEAFDSGTGTLTAWVRVPAVSAALDTTIHLYYGAGDAPDQSSTGQVWAGELAAWHLAADPTGDAPTLDDSGPSQHDGLALADAVLSATPSGPAVALDGTTDRLEAAPFDLPDGPLTVSAWFQATSPLVEPVLVAQGDPTTTGVFELGIDNTTTPGSPTARFRLRAGGTTYELSGGVIVPATWQLLTATWDGATIELFVDGVSVGSGPASGTTADGSAMPVVLGGDPAGARTLKGYLGEVRLSSRVWSGSEISLAAAYHQSPGATVSAAAPTGGTWFDQGDWTVRHPLTVDADLVAGALTDYPLLVQLSDVNLAAAAQADGDDLVFVGADGVTRLDHELESWNSVTGALTAWVRLPTLDDVVDTELFLYLGNGTAGDQQDPTGVWGPDADLVLNG
ncbi:MAG: signal peptidase I [Actinomycetia bacterium]|nr:signal peptidase I [Actinomycetes bacterium]